MSSSSSPRIALLTNSFTSETGRTFVLQLAKKFDIAVNDLPRLGVPKVQLENKGAKSVSIDGDAWKSFEMMSMAAREIKSGIDDLSMRGLPSIGSTWGDLRGCKGLTPEDMTKSILKDFGKNTIGLFSGTESGGRPAFTLVFVGEEGLEGGGSVPGSMGPLKSAIRGLTEAAATELGSYGINVNSYFTRAVRTTMESAESTTAPVDNLLGKNVDETPAGPAEMAEDVANVVSFLSSKSARSITGHIFGF
ncbi:hypothetical protein C0992_012194 [Termitomyces sp. T32_za158]|nr:hypothetical protein C0992_012194 [Termitomyces sp. T32_za158]